MGPMNERVGGQGGGMKGVTVQNGLCAAIISHSSSVTKFPCQVHGRDPKKSER